LPAPEEVAAFQEARRKDLYEQGLKIAEDKQKKAEERRALNPNPNPKRKKNEIEAVAVVTAPIIEPEASNASVSATAPPEANSAASPTPEQPVVEGAAQAAAREHFGRIRTVHLLLPSDIQPVTNWNYPSTDNEAIRMLIFEDLWRRQYYLTPAAKFGGDYLAYKGDPLKYHALFVVIIQPWTTQITARELVSIGRLAVTVKKAPVIATIDDRSKQVRYFTVDWQGVT
jgi:tRNA-splicing endonuclease subunit Sen34